MNRKIVGYFMLALAAVIYFAVLWWFSTLIYALTALGATICVGVLIEAAVRLINHELNEGD